MRTGSKGMRACLNLQVKRLDYGKIIEGFVALAILLKLQLEFADARKLRTRKDVEEYCRIMLQTTHSRIGIH